MTPLEMIAEYKKGCSIATPDNLEACPACAVAFIDILERKLTRELQAHSINYEALLKKYMQFLLEYEGSAFVDNLDSYMMDTKFTEEEVKALEGIYGRLCD